MITDNIAFNLSLNVINYLINCLEFDIRWNLVNVLIHYHNVEGLKLLLEKGSYKISNSQKEKIYGYGCQHNIIELLQIGSININFISSLINVAYQCNNHNIVQWLHIHYYIRPRKLIRYADQRRDIYTLKYISEQYPIFMKKQGVCTLAVKYNNLEFLQWCYNKGFSITKKTYKLAFKGDNDDLKSWIYDITPIPT